jgi:hypothetical protein
MDVKRKTKSVARSGHQKNFRTGNRGRVCEPGTTSLCSKVPGDLMSPAKNRGPVIEPDLELQI